MLARVVAVAALFACLTVLSGAASAAVSVSQVPCDKPGEPACVTFNNTGPVLTARSITFAAPARGRAVVTFNGYLQCASSDVTQERALEVRMQIVDGSEGPDETGAGGLLVRTGLGIFSVSQTGLNQGSFNLTTSRSFLYSAAGAKTFRFKINRVTVNPLTNCKVNVATFTVQFAP